MHMLRTEEVRIAPRVMEANPVKAFLDFIYGRVPVVIPFALTLIARMAFGVAACRTAKAVQIEAHWFSLFGLVRGGCP